MKKRYDFERAAKIAAHNECVCPAWRGTTVRKVLRKLVRQAAREAQKKAYVKDPIAIDRIAKELIP